MQNLLSNMNLFLLAIFLSQMHFLLTAPNPNVPNQNHLLQQYAVEVTKRGNKILAELKKPESTMNLRTECSYLEFDAEQIISQCKEEKHAEGCRKWWLNFRNSVGINSYKGMMLMPNYVQYYRELIELAEECQQGKNAKKGHGNIYDNLYGGTMPCYKPLHKGGKEITSNNCWQTEEWKKRFQKYFEGAQIEDTGNDMIDEGNDIVTVYYNEIFKHNEEILNHPAIFVYNTIIHFEGQTGVFIHTLDEYVPDKDNAHRQEIFRTTKSIHQIQAILDSLATKQFPAGKFDQMKNNCVDFAKAMLRELGANSNQLKLLIEPSKELLKARQMDIKMSKLR